MPEIKYTKEEVFVLGHVIDKRGDLGLHEIIESLKRPHNGCWLLAFLKVYPKAMGAKIGNFISKKFGNKLGRAFQKNFAKGFRVRSQVPIEEIPMMLGQDGVPSIVARWRLKIGR